MKTSRTVILHPTLNFLWPVYKEIICLCVCHGERERERERETVGSEKRVVLNKKKKEEEVSAYF